MNSVEEIETIIKIKLRRGEINSVQYVGWLVEAGLTPDEAEIRLDQLIAEVEAE